MIINNEGLKIDKGIMQIWDNFVIEQNYIVSLYLIPEVNADLD